MIDKFFPNLFAFATLVVVNNYPVNAQEAEEESVILGGQYPDGLSPPDTQITTDPHSDQINVIYRNNQSDVADGYQYLASFDYKEISSFSPSSLNDIIQTLLATSGYLRANNPYFIVNGRRITSFDEISSFPPEAVIRVEFLPAGAGSVFGAPPDRPIINIQLRENFAAQQIQVRTTLRDVHEENFYQAKFGSYNSSRDRRKNFSIEAGSTHSQTLFGIRTYSLNASETRSTSRGTRTLALNGALSSEVGNIIIEPTFSTRPRRVVGTGEIALAIDEGSWRLAGSVNTEYRELSDELEEIRTPTGSVRSIRNHATAINLEAQRYNPLLIEGFQFTSIASFGATLDHIKRSIDTSNGHWGYRVFGAFGIDVPLEDNFRWAINANTRLDAADGRVLGRHNISLRWQPMPTMQVIASYSSAENSIGRGERLAPLTISYVPSFYDFSEKRTRYVNAIRGFGGADVFDQRKKITATVRAAIDRHVSFSFIAEREDINNDRLTNLSLNRKTYAAFAERFMFDESGNLEYINVNNFHLDKRLKETLIYNLDANYKTADDGLVYFNFSHVFRIRDKAHSVGSSLVFDFLHGDNIEYAVGTPRQSFDFHLGYSELAFGGRIIAHYDTPATSNLDYLEVGRDSNRLRTASGVEVGFRAFLNLDAFDLWRIHPWISGRVSVAFDNIFRAARRISDRRTGGNIVEMNGICADYYCSRNQTSGRSMHFTFRKYF